jgi:hypothetical protein
MAVRKKKSGKDSQRCGVFLKSNRALFPHSVKNTLFNRSPSLMNSRVLPIALLLDELPVTFAACIPFSP